MSYIFIIFCITALLLILFSFLRIAESAFIHIPFDFLDKIDDPNPSDYRIDKYLNKPAPILISFSFLKYILIIVVFCGIFISFQYLLKDCSLFFISTLATLSTILLLWIFGELIPLAFNNTNVCKTFKSSFFIIVPISSFIISLKKIFPYSFARHENRISRKDMISISDISNAIENSEVEDEEVMEKQLIKGIINFGDLEVKEIMRARIDVVSIQINENFDNVITKMLDAGYSRYPVYEESLDDIKGIIYIKDLMPAMMQCNNADYNWQQHLRHALFVPENMKISQLLVDFQSKKMHIAVVIDEYGGTSGIVSLEDILEEIVGEINDEHDSDSDLVLAKEIGENTFIFDAKIPIHDFVKFTNLSNNLFEDFEGEVETLGGIILSINGNFPTKNQIIVFKNIEFTVLSMNKYRIGNVKVKINEEEIDN